ncbi:MAG TPA: FAD-dependent oxidoreductase [Candidatus Binataceae bacterium]|nr:FAD-dependent oxidoreductase [Candidatus Binataceae bacterium]
MSSKHAVVMGGGIGGMCAARVLADHFDKVTLIERDELPIDAVHRKGVPQSRHPHVMLDRGRRELNSLFPGLDEKLRAQGSLDLDGGLDLAVMQPDGWGKRRRTGHQMLGASRLLIEKTIRERIKQNPRITILEGTEATGLVTTSDRGRICGVDTRRIADGHTERIEADLIVDCSGRSSRVPQWLEKLGYPPVEREEVDANAGYSTCWYQAPPASQLPGNWWWKGIFLNPPAKPTRPEDYYFALILPIEGDRFTLTLASWGGRVLPADHESFAALCAKLRSPIVAEALAISKPISPIFHRRGMQNLWNHYENWQGPAGFISLADAACGFNPVYGQGMTSASVCAQILRQLLTEMTGNDPAFPSTFFKRQAEFVRQPWSLSVARDRQALAAERGTTVADDPFGGPAFERIAREGVDNPVIAEALFNVLNLNRPPDTLATDQAFLAAVNELLQKPPRPVPDADQIPPYPPETIIN